MNRYNGEMQVRIQPLPQALGGIVKPENQFYEIYRYVTFVCSAVYHYRTGAAVTD